jgi:hypothetical protein
MVTTADLIGAPRPSVASPDPAAGAVQRFVNVAGVALDFELGGVRYRVAIGATVEIPERVAYAVGKHGLPLAPEAR